LADIYLQNLGLFEHSTVISAVEQIDDCLAISVDETIIRPAGGGQPSDRAIVRSENWTMPVTQVRKVRGNTVIIIEKRPNIAPRPGARINLRINPAYRFSLSQSHSLAHVIMAALRNVLEGFEAEQANIGRGAEEIEVRFRCRETVTSDLVAQVDILARTMVAHPIPIVAEYMTSDADLESRLRRSRAGLEPRFAQDLRVIHIRGIDASLCSGTHVGSTRDIGAYSIEGVHMEEGTTHVMSVKRRDDWIRWYGERAIANCDRIQLSSVDFFR
jgi:alanyl-tRNA synthetase